MAGESSAQPPRQPPSADGELRKLGRYTIERKIGQGGMGAVYLGRDPDLKRLVALKVLPRDKAENPVLVKRFKAEAQAAAQLRHENIVAVFESGEDAGYLYIAMEYVDGKDLHEWIRKRGRIPVNRTIDIVKQVAAALQHAHEQNIVHRDIKPSNLLIRQDGLVKLTDLGLARSVDDTLETNITRAGTTVGTVDYMAPEQARNSKLADIRSDLYSLGCTWFHMLTGQAPYSEGSVTNKLQAHAIRAIPNARDLNPKIPEGLVAVLNRLMAKNPQERYQTPNELLADLQQSTLSRGAVADEIMDSIEEEAREEAVLRGEEPPEPSKRQFRRSKETGLRSSVAHTPLDADEDSETELPVTADEQSTTAPKRRQRKPVRGEADESGEPELLDGDNNNAEPAAATRKSEKSDSRSRPARSRSLPPKQQLSEPAEEREGLNLEKLKSIAVILGVVMLVLGLGWLTSRFAAGLFSGPGQLAATDPFANQPVPGGAIGVEPVAGAAAMTDPAAQPNPTAKAGAQGEGATGSTDPMATTPGGESTASPGAEPFDPKQSPKWADQIPPTTGLKTVTVSTDPETKGDQPTLSAAVRALGPKGGRVQILGGGLLTLPGQLSTTAARLVIEAADSQQRPVLVCEQNSAAPGLGLSLLNGSLELQGLHFAANAATVTGTDAVSLVTVSDGQLVVRDCSLTVSGSGSAPVAAVMIKGNAAAKPGSEPRVLIERSLLRGQRMTAIEIQRADIDVVVRQSLLLSAQSSVVVVESPGLPMPAEPPAADLRRNSERTLRFQQSTLVAGQNAIAVRMLGDGAPPLTDLVLQDSVCCTAGQAGATLLDATRWPASRGGQESGQLLNLQWHSQHSLYLGFAPLVATSDATLLKVNDAGSWQRFWGSSFDAVQFQAGPFPAAAPADWSQFIVAELDRARIPVRDVVATHGGIPGCDTTALSLPDSLSQERIQALSMRPAVPSRLTQAPEPPPQVLKVDLLKEDLGVVLSRTTWPSGTLIEATGHGVRTMSPVKLVDLSVRVHFRQTEGAPPLVIQPRIMEGKTGPKALIHVENGGLELIGAPLSQVATSKEGVPEYLIAVHNGQLLLRNCQLMGPAVDGIQHRGLVRWTSLNPGPTRPFLQIDNSLLYSPGQALQVEGAPGQIGLDNTIVVARGTGLDLAPARVGSGFPLTVDLRNCTIAATQSAVRIPSMAAEGTAQPPLRLYVDETAFTGPFVMKPGEADRATILACDPGLLSRHDVEWWGRANGVSPELPSLLRPDSGSGAGGGPAEWHAAWGADRDSRLLTGDQGVYYATPLAGTFKSLKPQAFGLHRSARASTWGTGGRSIGADVNRVGPEVSPAQPAPPKPTGAPGRPGVPKKPSF